jgi:hypothetical protein
VLNADRTHHIRSLSRSCRWAQAGCRCGLCPSASVRAHPVRNHLVLVKRRVLPATINGAFTVTYQSLWARGT